MLVSKTTGKPVLPERSADPFDVNKFPFGKKAGDNKMGLLTCPTCTKPPTIISKEDYSKALGRDATPPNEGFYLFRDKLSAKEYTISGMCQDCQDDVFGTED